MTAALDLGSLERDVAQKKLAVDAAAEDLRRGWEWSYDSIALIKKRATDAVLALRKAERALEKARARAAEKQAKAVRP